GSKNSSARRIAQHSRAGGLWPPRREAQMGYPIQRIPGGPRDEPRPGNADRARLLERVAVGLAHEGKNPLHNMVLHLQLMNEKLSTRAPSGGSPIEKHLNALRDGIGRVDQL